MLRTYTVGVLPSADLCCVLRTSSAKRNTEMMQYLAAGWRNRPAAEQITRPAQRRERLSAPVAASNHTHAWCACGLPYLRESGKNRTLPNCATESVLNDGPKTRLMILTAGAPALRLSAYEKLAVSPVSSVPGLLQTTATAWPGATASARRPAVPPLRSAASTCACVARTGTAPLLALPST